MANIESLMDTSDYTEPTTLICVRCGQSNDYTVSRCSECGAPLDAFASTAPWEMGTAMGASYPAPVDPRTKPVIFWGAWLYFGPSAIGSLWIIGSTLYPVITGEAKARDLVDGLAMMLLATLYGALSIWTLWAVSARYFRRTR